jgi:glyoxylase-like metal-dependent hydrolase (beta-lactamase superfamily II)
MNRQEVTMTTRITVLCGILLAAALPAAAVPPVELKPVVPNVYLAVFAEQAFVNCNSAVIVLEDGVLVVDSQATPAAARVLIEEVKKVTSKPIRWIVNSHLHWDHVQGNAAYVGKWPAGAEIISSEATRADIERLARTRVAAERVTLPRRVADLKKELAEVPASRRTALEAELASTEAYLSAIRAMELPLPTTTFDRSMTIRRGGTTVQLLWLGRGHTDGDVVVYLPNEKVVVTGDAVHGYAPYMGDSCPFDWIDTLDRLAGLDFEYLLSGHGDLIRGKAQIRLWQEFLRDLLSETTESVRQGFTLAQTIERVGPVLRGRFSTRFPPGSFDDLDTSIRKAWTVIAFQGWP